MASEIMQVIQSQQLERHQDNDLQEDNAASQYLSFLIEEQTFATKIHRVQEIRAWETPTYLPNSPDYLKGVLNLRGIIVPVIDLRIRLKFTKIKYCSTTVIIIFKSMETDRDRLMGCVVDAVSDVFDTNDRNLSEMPDFDSGIDRRFSKGLIDINGEAVTLLNLDTLMDLDLIDHPHSRIRVAAG